MPLCIGLDLGLARKFWELRSRLGLQWAQCILVIRSLNFFDLFEVYNNLRHDTIEEVIQQEINEIRKIISTTVAGDAEAISLLQQLQQNNFSIAPPNTSAQKLLLLANILYLQSDEVLVPQHRLMKTAIIKYLERVKRESPPTTPSVSAGKAPTTPLYNTAPPAEVAPLADLVAGQNLGLP